MPFLLGHHKNTIYGVMESTTDVSYFESHQEQQHGADGTAVMLCVAGIPDRMIPTDFLHVFQQEKEHIETIRFYKQMIRNQNDSTVTSANATPNVVTKRIFHGNNGNNRYLAALMVKSMTAAKEIQEKYHQLLLSSIYDARCEVSFVCAIHMVKSTPTVPTGVSSSLSASATSVHEKGSQDDFEYLTLTDLRSLIDDYGTQTLLNTGNTTSTGSSVSCASADTASSASAGVEIVGIEGEEKCAVCLGTICPSSNPSMVTEGRRPRCPSLSEPHEQDDSVVVLCCSHKFHFHCLLQLDKPQCPVCR
jgi:hypothetical protein